MAALETVPVSLWQKYVLDEAAHPDCLDDLRDRMILTNALLVKPGIDVRRLRRAVQRLRRRHDTLRIRFDQVKGIWRARLDPKDADILRVIDVDDLDDQSFHAQVSLFANAPMPLINHPMLEVVVLRSGERGDVLILRVHHAITDGYGMVVLVEDLIKYLVGLPVLTKAISHCDYVARFQSPKGAEEVRNTSFWKELHHDFPKAPCVGRKAKGLDPLVYAVGEVDQKQLFFGATPDSLRRLEDKAKCANNTPTMALFAGYFEALCQCYDLEKLMFLTSISRSDPALDSYVGNHTFNPVLPYVSQGSTGLAQATHDLGDLMIRAMAHLPSDAARPNVPYRTELIESGGYPTQFYVHQPRPTSRQNRSAFKTRFESSYSEAQQFGPVSLTQINVSVRHRTFSDMVFGIGAAKVRSGFTIEYDGISYEDTEIRKLGDTICALLELDQTEVTSS